MKIEPFNDRVICIRSTRHAKTAGGIYIPATAKERNFRSVVHAIGPDVGDKRLKKGDEIIVNKWVVEKLTIDGEPYDIVKEEDISCRVSE